MTLFWGTPKSLQMVTAAMKLRHLLLGRKAMPNLDSILKSKDITLPPKSRLVKTMVLPVVMYGCEIWIIKKVSAKELILEKTLEDPLDSKEIHLVHPKGNQSIHWKD